MKFRSEILLVPVAIICLALLGRSANCTVGFEDVVPQGNTLALRHLVTLGVCIVAGLLALKHWGQDR